MIEAIADETSTVRLMWESRRKAISSALEELDRHPHTTASIALIFQGGPVIGARDIRADFSAKVLGDYQHLISAVFAEQVVEQLHGKGPLPHSARSRLFVRDLARGSVGFVLEEAPTEQAELMPTSLSVAVQKTTKIIRDLSTATLSEFEQRVAPLKPRILKAISSLTNTLVEFGAQTEIVDDAARLSLPQDETRTLNERLSEVAIAESVEARLGVLTGIFPDRLSFEFRADDVNGIDLYGDVTEELAFQYAVNAGGFVARHGLAEFLVLATVRAGRVIQEQRILRKFTPSPSEVS